MGENPVDDLVKLLTKSNHDLNVLHHSLEKEFKQFYPDNANPLKLVSRIRRIQEDLFSIKEQSRELLAAKQDLIDKASTLVRNRSLLQRMQATMGLHLVSNSDDLAYNNFNQVIEEWTSQVRSKTGNEMPESDTQDVNQLLFSAIVHDS